jgi:hypothetical protein
MCPMKSTIKVRFTEPQIALVMRAHPNCNLDRLTEVSFEFDQAGKIIDCIGKIKNEGNIPSRRARALLQDGTPLMAARQDRFNDTGISKLREACQCVGRFWK